MKKALAFVACMLAPVSAYAGRDGNLGLNIGYDSFPGNVAGAFGSANVGVSLRALNYTPLELHGEFNPSNGASAELRLHVFYCDYLALHLLDPGIYVSRGNPFFVRDDVDRNLDFTAGAGLSIFAWRGLEVSARVRWFLPNPGSTLPDIARGRYTRDEEPEEQTTNTGLLNNESDAQRLVNQEEERYRIRGNFAKGLYLDVLHAPAVGVAVVWYFF